MFQIFWKLFCVNFLIYLLTCCRSVCLFVKIFWLILWHNWCVVSEMTKNGRIALWVQCGRKGWERVLRRLIISVWARMK